MYCREAQMLGSEGSQTAPARPFGAGRLENGTAWESEERRRQVHRSEQQRAEAKQLLYSG
jgi:hypothetical protein